MRSSFSICNRRERIQIMFRVQMVSKRRAVGRNTHLLIIFNGLFPDRYVIIL